MSVSQGVTPDSPQISRMAGKPISQIWREGKPKKKIMDVVMEDMQVVGVMGGKRRRWKPMICTGMVKHGIISTI